MFQNDPEMGQTQTDVESESKISYFYHYSGRLDSNWLCPWTQDRGHDRDPEVFQSVVFAIIQTSKRELLF